jgi:hypothetical protein
MVFGVNKSTSYKEQESKNYTPEGTDTERISLTDGELATKTEGHEA